MKKKGKRRGRVVKGSRGRRRRERGWSLDMKIGVVELMGGGIDDGRGRECGWREVRKENEKKERKKEKEKEKEKKKKKKEKEKEKEKERKEKERKKNLLKQTKEKK